MALEKLFVDRDVLDRNQPPARLVLDDRVDQQRGIAVAQAVEYLRYVDRHPASVYQKVIARLSRATRVRARMVRETARRLMRQLKWVMTLAVALAATACGGSDSPTTPTAPTPVALTDTFPGTLNPNGGNTHPFLIAAAGQATATLTTVAPDSTVVVGLSLGTWNGNACAIVLAKDNAIQGSTIIGSA